METKNKEILDRISEINIEYGKDAAFGYAIGILEQPN